MPAPRHDTDANKAIVRSFIEAWNNRDFARFEDLMADTCQLAVGADRVSCSPSSTREIAEYWVAAFPDWRFELLDLVAEGDRVVALMPYSGTQDGDVLDIPATRRRVQVSEIVIFRIADGRIAEAWEVYDECGMRRQLGGMPASV
jgi:steroid delta-isomerase-like uncharacterized protein